MGQIGVAWGGGGPNMAGAGASLGEALSSAIGGGGGGGWKAQEAAAKNAAYIESLNRHNKLYDAQTALTQQKITSDANEAAIKADENMRVGQQADRAQNAANSEWMAQDARIKPAGVGVLAPTAPAIVEYDTNSKAIKDRLAYTYGNGDGAPASRADAANSVVGGVMVQQGSPEDYQRGNAMMGKPLGEKDIIPGKLPASAEAPANLPADAYPGMEKMTGDQANAANFANRMSKAGAILERPEITAAGQDRWEAVKGAVPLIGNSLVSDNYQMNDQAARDFINATMRRESGSAISPQEFDNARRQYLPQPGDGPDVLAQKKANRESAMSGVLIGATPEYRQWFYQKHAAPAAGAAPTAGIQPGHVEDGHRYIGGDPSSPSSWEPVQ